MAKDTQTPDTRARIMAAASQLFLEHGYEGTTLPAILEGAGISNGSFFHFFPKKADVAGAICLEALEGYFAAVRSAFPFGSKHLELAEVVRSLIGTYLTWTVTERDAARLVVLLRPQMRDKEMCKEIARLDALLEAEVAVWVGPLIRSGKMRDLPPQLVLALVLGSAQALCLDWLYGEGKPLPDIHKDILLEAACMALHAPAPAKATPAAKSTKRGAVPVQITEDLFNEPR